FDHKNRAALRTVVAKTGTMRNSDDGNTLILELHDGEIHEPDPGDRQKYRRTAFQSQTFYLGGVGDEFTRSESSYRTDREKSAAQMREDVEAWTATLQSRWRTLNHACSTMIAAYFLELPDSLNPDVSLPIARASFQGTRHPRHILERARDRVNRVNSIIERETAAIRNQQRLINQHLIEIYKKYSIPVACLSFALIACPLAARSRRRGIGSGLGISLGLFLVYWAFLIGGEDLADRGIVTPFTAMWSADILIAVIGLALLWSVANEVPLSPRAVWHWIRRHIGGGTGSTKETGR
ncbi:MAG TPA: LptF/LptG family permease, partial [Acidobacteriota bacterium]|nr:LptF/LptG family permease [Acidobacteriota bacterium]